MSVCGAYMYSCEYVHMPVHESTSQRSASGVLHDSLSPYFFETRSFTEPGVNQSAKPASQGAPVLISARLII